MGRRSWVASLVVGVAVIFAACGTSGSSGLGGGTGTTRASIIVLNSLSRTVQQFNIEGQTLVPFGTTFNLPPNYDGVAIDLLSELMVTTTSALNGSQIVWGDLSTGTTIITGFPGAQGSLADPGRATLIVDVSGTIGALVAARAENTLYIAFPSQQNASVITDQAGEFVERILPFGNFLFALDSNLDDAGGTFASLGDARIKAFRLQDGSLFDDFELTGAKNVTDALVFNDQFFVLAGGTFTTNPFAPAGDGTMVVVNAPDRGVREVRSLQGNGLSIEAGLDGLAYVTRTVGTSFDETDVLTFNFFSENFERGPSNPIKPKNADGSSLNNCRATTALFDKRILCVTFEGTAQGRLVLMDQNGGFIDEAPIGAGATDIIVR